LERNAQHHSHVLERATTDFGLTRRLQDSELLGGEEPAEWASDALSR